jgi:hypothetical protein
MQYGILDAIIPFLIRHAGDEKAEFYLWIFLFLTIATISGYASRKQALSILTSRDISLRGLLIRKDLGRWK